MTYRKQRYGNISAQLKLDSAGSPSETHKERENRSKENQLRKHLIETKEQLAELKEEANFYQRKIRNNRNNFPLVLSLMEKLTELQKQREELHKNQKLFSLALARLLKEPTTI